MAQAPQTPGFASAGARPPEPPAAAAKKRLPLHTKIFIGMIAGAAAGVAANLTMGDSPALRSFVDNVSYPAGQIFLRLIFMVVIPLVVSALILGVAELGDVRRLGRVGLKTLAFTLVLSSISVLIGVTLANLVKPGAGLSDTSRAALMEIMGKSSRDIERPPAPKAGLQIFLDLIPQNPVEAMVNAFRGDILAVMVFALFLGIAVTLVDRKKAEPLLVWLQAVFEVVMKAIDIAMRLAPYGVAALLFTLMARSGLDVLAKLGLYVATVLAGLAIHQFVTYSLMLKFVVKYPPTVFFARIREVMVTAFSTSSSNATLPTTLRVAETGAGDPAADRRVRPDAGLHPEPERHRPLRGDHRPLPGPVLRDPPFHRKPDHGGAPLDPGGDRDGGRARRLAAAGDGAAGHGGRPRRGDRHHPGRGPDPRHVPHRPQRHRRPHRRRLRGEIRRPHPEVLRPSPHPGASRSPRVHRAGVAILPSRRSERGPEKRGSYPLVRLSHPPILSRGKACSSARVGPST